MTTLRGSRKARALDALVTAALGQPKPSRQLVRALNAYLTVTRDPSRDISRDPPISAARARALQQRKEA
jgi:hypothetical protein